MSEVVGDAIRLATIGVGLGVAGALFVASLMRPLLFGVGSFHLPTYAVTVIVLLSCTVLAASLLAWRASRAHPVEALRSE